MPHFSEAKEAAKELSVRDVLMKRLIKVQNTERNWNQDIVTFSAFLNDAELLAHVERYEAYQA